MVLAGKLIFLLMSCFNMMARGGLQPFFRWLADNSAYIKRSTNRPGDRGSLQSNHNITAGLAMGMDFFILGFPLLKPKNYKLGELVRKPIVIYSDAEWTVLDKEPWLHKGLGGILFEPGHLPVAEAVDCPQELVDALGGGGGNIFLLFGIFSFYLEYFLFIWNILGLQPARPRFH